MSDAIRDGDQILGAISGTSVLQNQNFTPVFVPNSPSLPIYFRTSLRNLSLASRQITVVEAHGTGTQVGDPAEYSSIKAVLGGPRIRRTSPLALGSVKGLVGHTECASGGCISGKDLAYGPLQDDTHHRPALTPSAHPSTATPADNRK